MAWLEIHQALPTHRKLHIAAGQLGVEPITLMGHLIAFWLWAIDNAPQGDITGLSPKIISGAAHWKKNAVRFVEVMTTTRWFDADGESLYIHNWQNYAGRLMDKRRMDADRKRDVRRMSHGSPQDVQSYSTLPNSTLPYRETLREIPEWKERGEPHEESLALWVKRKNFTEDDLERAAIGLGKVQEKTLKGYSNLARAFQDRLNKRYDLEDTNDRKPGSRAEAIRREAEEQRSRLAR